MSNKVIINQFIGGLGNVTTLTLPDDPAPGEIVAFGQSANELAGTNIFVSGDRNVGALGSATFVQRPSNPVGPNTLWVNNGGDLYLGADPVGGIELAPIGNTPAAEGASVAGLTLTLQPASNTLGGVLSASAQLIGGEKTFVDNINAEKNIVLPATTGPSEGCLVQDGSPILHSYGGPSNLFIGPFSCIDNVPAPASENTSVGNNALRYIVDPAQGNTALGCAALADLETGVGNTAVGWTSLFRLVYGSRNVGIGSVSLSNCTGSRNIGIGYDAGSNVTATDNTINIGNSGNDVTGEINIGTVGTHTTTSIAGIAGAAPGGTPQAVIINPANGRLGSTAIAAPVSFTPVGGSPNPDGASVVANAITLQPASATNPGVLTTGAQTIAGAKTLSDPLVASGSVTFPAVTGNPGGTPQAVIINPSTGLLGSQTAVSLTKTTGSVTATLNAGATITTMTVRGTATTTVTANFTKMDNLVTMTLPQMTITAMTGAPEAVVLNGLVPAAYRPTFLQKLATTVHSAGMYNSGHIDVNSNGNVVYNKDTYTALVTPCGLFRDTTVSWLIV